MRYAHKKIRPWSYIEFDSPWCRLGGGFALRSLFWSCGVGCWSFCLCWSAPRSGKESEKERAAPFFFNLALWEVGRAPTLSWGPTLDKRNHRQKRHRKERICRLSEVYSHFTDSTGGGGGGGHHSSYPLKRKGALETDLFLISLRNGSRIR